MYRVWGRGWIVGRALNGADTPSRAPGQTKGEHGRVSGERNGSRRSFKRPARREVAALSLASLLLLLVTAGALAVTGDLTQPAGAAGCVSEDGSGPCADGHGLNGAVSVAVSPDGKSVYLASNSSAAVARFIRAP